jgi:hypothetical protein
MPAATRTPTTRERRSCGWRRLLPADETQLLYSLCLHGRGELGLAPDEYAALTMVLLRLLAFKPPAAVSASAEKKTLNPGLSRPPAPAPRAPPWPRPSGAAPPPAARALPLRRPPHRRATAARRHGSQPGDRRCRPIRAEGDFWFDTVMAAGGQGRSGHGPGARAGAAVAAGGARCRPVAAAGGARIAQPAQHPRAPGDGPAVAGHAVRLRSRSGR